MDKKLDDKKVVVGMSGGIDSSVAALLLKQQGYEVIGVTLKHLPDELSENPGKTCCSLDDINDARYTCYTLEIPHYVLNVVEEFKRDVMEYFVKMYNAGKTPSPCVICDEKVKIRKVSPNTVLLWDKNNRKDQSYMLYRLDKEVVERFLFPLSEYKKSEVREIARQNGIHTHNKPDSQGICFAPNGYIPFLKKVLGNDVKKGNFVDKSGKIIGEHIGYQFYTVGQRRGLGLNLGKPFFVLELRPETNEVVVGDFEELLVKEIEVINYKFHCGLENIIGVKLTARPRFSSRGLTGKLKILEDEKNKLIFEFDEKTHENSEGQHIVFYLENEIVGGGEIKNI